MHARWIAAIALIATAMIGCTQSKTDWRQAVDEQLPMLGHRNWIVIADAAYPWQTAPGIETIYTGASQIEVVEVVLTATDQAPHVDPIIYVDNELRSVSDADAPGIAAYRESLNTLLGDRQVNRLPHEDIIAKLDEAGGTFRVLLLKTDMTLPYTSVFIELYCGYWDREREQRLRDAINATP